MLQEQGSSSSREGAMFGAPFPMAFATVDAFDKVTASGKGEVLQRYTEKFLIVLAVYRWK